MMDSSNAPVTTRVSLGYTPRAWQRDVHQGLSNKRWGALVCHRRAGKTVLAVMQLLHKAIECQRPHGRYAYIAPFLKQAKAIAWGYLKQYASKIPGTTIAEGELHVTLPNGAQIRLYGGDNADALRGVYLDGLVLDEVAQLSKELWDSVLRPALSDRNGWALLMGTPNGINLLSEAYFKARTSDEWFSGSYTVYQTEALPKTEIEALKSEMTVSAFAREFLCDFSAAVDNVLLSVHEVEAATRRHFDVADYQMAPKILGVDVARQGDDRTAIFPRQGLFGQKPFVFRHLDAMQVAAQVLMIDKDFGADAIFVDGSGGYGAGVIDRLRQLGKSVIEVQFGGKADDPRYANKRAEMWWRMAEWVKQHGLIPDIQELKQDLCGPTYGQDRLDRMMLEAKDAIKKRGLPSPDLGDALALTFAYPVASKYDNIHPNHGGLGGGILSDYDPVAAFLKEQDR